MKKNKSSKKISPEEALEFLDGIRKMTSEIDEPTVAISLRIPANLLRALKIKAKSEGKKYQSLLVAYIRSGLIQK